jgi:hypothetical protein
MRSLGLLRSTKGSLWCSAGASKLQELMFMPCLPELKALRFLVVSILSVVRL